MSVCQYIIEAYGTVFTCHLWYVLFCFIPLYPDVLGYLGVHWDKVLVSIEELLSFWIIDSASVSSTISQFGCYLAYSLGQKA